MWVSQASISLSAGWDTQAGLVPAKQNYSVDTLTLCRISPWNEIVVVLKQFVNQSIDTN